MKRMSLRRPRPLLHVCGRAAGVSVHAPVVSVPVETDVRSSNARSITSKSMSMSKAESMQVKPFEAIPGPRSLPYIGTLYKYLPFGENISIPLFFLFHSHLDPYTGYNIKVMKSCHVNRVYKYIYIYIYIYLYLYRYLSIYR